MIALLVVTSAQAADQRPISIVPALSHWGSANALAVSPNGKWIASASDNLKLWEFSSGRLVRDFEGHPGGLGTTALAFDPSGQFLISTGNGDPIKVWDIATGRRLTFMKDDSNRSIRADWLALSRDGRRVAYSDFEGTKIRDMQTGALLRRFEGGGPVAFSPGSPRLVMAGSDATLKVLDVVSSQRVLTLEGHSRSRNNFAPHGENANGVSSLAVSPNGRIIASGSQDRTVKLWDAASGRLLRSIQAHGGAVKWLAITPDNNSVVSIGEGSQRDGSGDRSVKVWDIASGRLLRSISTNVNSAALSSDGRFVVTGEERSISVWSFDTGALLRRIRSENNAINSVDASLGTKIFSASWDGKLRFWNLQEGRLVRSINAHSPKAEAVAVSPDGRFVVSGDSKDYGAKTIQTRRSLKVWDAASGRLLRSLSGQEGDVESILFSPDGKYVLSSGLGKPVLWDFASGKLLYQLDAFARAVFNPNGRAILSGQYVQNIVSSWNLKSGRKDRDLARNVTAKYFAFSPDGARLFGAYNSRVIVFEGRNPPRLFGLHEDPTLMGIMDMKISKSGRMLATGAWNGTLKLWDLRGGSTPWSIQAHAHGIRSISFAKDESLLATSSNDGTIRLWNLRQSDAPLATLIASGETDWIIMTPDGFFAGSPNASSILSVVRGLEVITTEQVHQSLFNPDLVREALAGDPTGEYRKAVAATNLEKILNSGPAPLVRIVSPAPNSQTATDTLTVATRVTDRGKGIGRIEWRVNGITAAVETSRTIPGTEYVASRSLALDTGENVIEVVAYNAANLLASVPSRIKLTLVAAPDLAKPKLHVLAIGINAYVDQGWTAPGTTELKRFPPLNLAVTDAASIADALQKAAAGRYAEARVTLLKDQDATAAGIDAAVTRIANELHPRDTFVLFSAAHGLSLNGHFYLIPQDYQGGANPAALEKNAIGQGQLQDWIANRIKARRAVVLLDTCESGALISGHTISRTHTPSSEASVGRLHEATGRPILTAAASGKPAFEGYKGHGVFTYAVLDAIKNADTNGNGAIELSELVAHVQSLVPKISAELNGTGRAAVAVRGSAGHTQSARFGSRGDDFPLVQRLGTSISQLVSFGDGGNATRVSSPPQVDESKTGSHVLINPQMRMAPALSPTVEFTVANRTGSTVGVAFFDGTNRQRIDPPEGRIYLQDGNSERNYRIDCTPGQSVCYGASKREPGLSPFWGTGRDGKENCKGCCLTCPTEGALLKTLNDSDSRRPTPSITWKVQKLFEGNLSVQFYSATRQYVWPGGNNAFAIRDQADHDFRLSCVASEKICYGAWIDGYPRAKYWGTGPGGVRGCKDCCGTCDGGTYSASLAN
jgi:WD40 repeat protein